MSQISNVGVVGYGLSAKIFHIPFINASKAFKLHSIVQRSPKPQDDASKDWPEAKVYRSIDELVQDPDVDVVVLTTTPVTHFALASQALRAKKHVLVEKPFTPTSTEARDLVKIAKEEGVMLTVYQNRRYDADFLTLKKLIEDGALGRVVEFESHFDRHRPQMPAGDSWKTSPEEYSVVFDLGTHLMDQVVALYGLPQRITGFVGSQRGKRNTSGLEDTFTALLHYDDVNGEGELMATCKAGVVSAETEQLRYWVRGEKGSFRKSRLDVQEDQLKGGLRPGDSGYGVEVEDAWGVVTSVDGNGKVSGKKTRIMETAGYTAFYDQFGEALAAGDAKLLPVDAAVAGEVIRLCELMRQSSSERKSLTI